MIRLMQAFKEVRFLILGLAFGWFFVNPIITSAYSDKTLASLLINNFNFLSIIGFIVLAGFVIALKYFILRYSYPNQG
ncbi:MAG: hypothetical protein Q8Q89_03600 [bacterium]|nr:hypothetical protein [bacterium]